MPLETIYNVTAQMGKQYIYVSVLRERLFINKKLQEKNTALLDMFRKL